MSDVLADTHAAIWFLWDPAKLSPAADSVLTAASNTGKVYISAITLIEVSYLSNKPNFPYSGILPQLFSLASDPSEALEVLPVTLDVARALERVPRAEVADMPDRIVAATAIAHNLPLVSIDTDVRASASLRAIVPVIW